MWISEQRERGGQEHGLITNGHTATTCVEETEDSERRRERRWTQSLMCTLCGENGGQRKRTRARWAELRHEKIMKTETLDDDEANEKGVVDESEEECS